MAQAKAKLALAFVAALASLYAQQESDEVRTRRIWDANLQQERPQGAPASQSKKSKAPVRAGDEAYVGMTLWRLRPSKAGDAALARILVHPPASNKEEDWTPERCEASTPLTEGQMVRLGIETAREGYLYVFDREQYADGTYSDAQLIFPTLRIRQGNNKVKPGEVVEIPSWDAKPNYLLVSRSRPDEIAEVLTVILAPQPISGLRIGTEQAKISKEQLSIWEKSYASDVKKLEAAGQAGKAYTEVEAEAGKNLKMLNAGDPLPQTMYRVKARPGDPLLVNVPLKIQ